jgi:hypothetical protein
MGHTSRSIGLLRVEASQARVSQSGLKTGGGVTQIVHMTSSQRSHGDRVEDGRVNATGCVRPCYPYFAVFIVLVPMDIFIFYLGL